MLSQKFTDANILIKQADNDADVFIIEIALERCHEIYTTVIVGEDIDLLILLAARTPSDKTRESASTNENIFIKKFVCVPKM